MKGVRVGGLPTPAEGDLAPDFHLPTVDGGVVALGELRGQPAVLIFLRHLG